MSVFWRPVLHGCPFQQRTIPPLERLGRHAGCAGGVAPCFPSHWGFDKNNMNLKQFDHIVSDVFLFCCIFLYHWIIAISDCSVHMCFMCVWHRCCLWICGSWPRESSCARCCHLLSWTSPWPQWSSPRLKIRLQPSIPSGVIKCG